MKRLPYLGCHGTIGSALLLLSASLVWGQNAKPPTQLTYQGFLTDANGLPFGNTAPVNKTLTFRIYDAPTGGSLKWSSQQVVTVDKGYFSVLLGQGGPVGTEPFSVDLTGVFAGTTASDRYLELNADGTTIAPRLRFLPAPYAMLARSATELLDPATGSNSLSVAGGNVSVGGSLAAGTINVSGTVTAAHLSGNAANLTNLNASYVATGTLAADRIPGLDGSKITAGTLANARTTATSANTANAIVARDASGSFFANVGTFGTTGVGVVSQGFYGDSGNIALRAPANGATFFQIYNGARTDMYIANNGNVGIGTTVPASRLHISEAIGTVGGSGLGTILLDHENDGGSSSITFRSKINRGGADYGYISYQDNPTDSATGGESAIFTIGIQNDSDDHIALMASGYVGVGTTNPQYPLDVRRSVTRTFNLQAYVNASGAFDNNSDRSDLSTTIWAEGNVQAASFWVRSDARIKAATGRTPADSALAKIRQLQVTDYRYVDSVAMGRSGRRGFIAQEVEQLIPEAVGRSSGLIPDIYTVAAGTEFDAETRSLTVILGKPHGLEVNDVVKLMLQGSEGEFKVTAVPAATHFVVMADSRPSEVFVYGRRVDDFLSVDYDHIYTTGIAAIQDLAQQVEQQAEALRKSEERAAQLEQQVAYLTGIAAEFLETRNRPTSEFGVEDPAHTKASLRLQSVGPVATLATQ